MPMQRTGLRPAADRQRVRPLPPRFTESPMSLETTHLSLTRCSPVHILTLIEDPERFEQVAGFPSAAGAARDVRLG